MLVLSDDFGNRVELLGGLRNMDPEIFSRSLEVTFRNETLRSVGREAAERTDGQPSRPNVNRT